MEISPDPKYNNLLVSKFINQVMREGKKFLAQKIVYECFENVQKKTEKNPLEIFSQALKSASPRIETKPRRVGGATYQVPIEVQGDRQVTLAMRWILEATRKKKGKMEDKLAEELILAAKGEGGAIKKRINTERMAEANKAFAHLARKR
jgi:small subunit ribosomal protein S7